MSRRALLACLALLEAITFGTGAAVVSRATEARIPVEAPRGVAAAAVVAPSTVAVVVTKPAPVRKATPRVRPQVRRPSAPARPPVVRRAAATRETTAKPRLTARLRMLAAVARIPGYQPGSVRWVMTSKYGSWGTADWYRGVVYISPRVPASRMYDVVAHEWSHILSVRPYDSVSQGIAGMNAVFGGSGLTGAERAADCMARKLGATWTHYTSCGSEEWQAASVRLLAGQPA